MPFWYLQGDHNDCFFQEYCKILSLTQASLLLKSEKIIQYKTVFLLKSFAEGGGIKVYLWHKLVTSETTLTPLFSHLYAIFGDKTLLGTFLLVEGFPTCLFLQHDSWVHSVQRSKLLSSLLYLQTFLKHILNCLWHKCTFKNIRGCDSQVIF